ncbi:MAG: hypothetical protein H7Z19_17455 [Chitinophagaceae bacterium]|nr:hypothetical protein [Rubrivivax sp.]
MRWPWIVGSVWLLGVLSACTETPQTLRKTDAKAWDAAQNGFVAPGWKSGDQSSWEEQMRNRAQAQNEYTRAPAAAQ